MLNLSPCKLAGFQQFAGFQAPKFNSQFRYGDCLILIILLQIVSSSYLRRGMDWHFPKVVGFELFTSMVMAFTSWQLFSACQKPSA